MRATEKYLRDYALLNALHPGTVPYREDEVEQTDTPRFDGGPRIDPDATRPRTRTELALDGVFGPFPSDEPGWVEYEIENGAELAQSADGRLTAASRSASSAS